MYQSMLVPLDGSAFAEQSLPLALAVAQKTGASLQLVRVVPRLPKGLVQGAKTAPVAGLPWLTYLDELVERLAKISPVSVTAQLLEGDPVAPTICDHVERTGVNLVVVTTHGRGPLGRFWVGSVAVELMYSLPIPILLIRPEGKEADWSTAPNPRRMLLTLDGSELAEHMLEPAVALGTALGVEYTLFRAVSDLPLPSVSMDSISLSAPSHEMLHQLREVQEQQCKEAEDYLEGVAQRLCGRDLRVRTEVAVGSDPASLILEAARETDLLGIESHGRRGLSRLVFGGVARKVIHGTPVPVLFHSATSRRRRA